MGSPKIGDVDGRDGASPVISAPGNGGLPWRIQGLSLEERLNWVNDMGGDWYLDEIPIGVVETSGTKFSVIRGMLIASGVW
jgi:hypothetical protein